MKFRWLLGIIALFAFLLGSLAWWVSASYQQDRVTSSLWQKEFMDMQGKLQKIPRPNKRPLVVNFWATWCGPCREEIPELVELALLYKGQVDFVGIALDNKVAVQQFLRTTNIAYPILLGQADILALMQAEGNSMGGVPFTVIYAASGHSLMTIAGKIKKDTLKQTLQSAVALPH
jgi:thiol-disulfide isomerase/thioredoxin